MCNTSFFTCFSSVCVLVLVAVVVVVVVVVVAAAAAAVVLFLPTYFSFTSCVQEAGESTFLHPVVMI